MTQRRTDDPTAAGAAVDATPAVEEMGIQPAGFLLELTLDWLIVRASENTHRFTGHYHQRLVGTPLSDVTLAQSLHDLRNSLARQRSRGGVAHAYRVRLFDAMPHFDIAHQTVDGRIILEGLPSDESGYGWALGAISRLIDGLVGDRQRVLDVAPRMMRALTGLDRVTLLIGGKPVSQSSRGSYPELQVDGGPDALPGVLSDVEERVVPVYPRLPDGAAARLALLGAPSARARSQLAEQGVRSILKVPLHSRLEDGLFLCEGRAPLRPSFELHAAAELFAQMVALRLNG